VKALLVVAGAAALLAVQVGTAVAQQPRMPRGIDPKTCSYNACITECIRCPAR
jgi:hypothetical protein